MFFDDTTRFPRGTVEFDSALLMLDIAAEWTARPTLAARPAVSLRGRETPPRMAAR